jgi:hypothetical protein
MTPRPIETEFLMSLDIEVTGSHILGDTPDGMRRVDLLGGGRFEGPRLRGTVLPGGSDLLLVRADGSIRTDVRLLLKTDDAATIVVTYRGSRHGSEDAMRRIAAGEEVPASDYYLRNAPFFETASPVYDWLNHIVAVGLGERIPGGARYDIYQVL